MAVDPQLGLMSMSARIEDELQRRNEEIEQSRAAVAAMVAVAAEFESRRVRAYGCERIDGLDAARRRLADLALSARSECLSFVAGGAQTADTLDASRSLDQQALARGVEIRTVYQDSFRNNPATLHYTKWLAQLGGRSRTVPTLPMVMVIIDRFAALVPLDPAADLLQETLVKAAGRWRRIATSGNPEAYIRTIMLNQLRTWRRPRKLAFFSTSEVPETAESDQSGTADNRVLLAQALAQLGAKQRAVLYLRYYEDLPEAEVARQLGCSVGTVKRHTHDALARLRRLAPELLERWKRKRATTPTPAGRWPSCAGDGWPGRSPYWPLSVSCRSSGGPRRRTLRWPRRHRRFPAGASTRPACTAARPT